MMRNKDMDILHARIENLEVALLQNAKLMEQNAKLAVRIEDLEVCESNLKEQSAKLAERIAKLEARRCPSMVP